MSDKKGRLNFNIPKVSGSADIAIPSPIINQWRPARRLHGNKQVVTALQLTREQAALGQRLLNLPWIAHMDYIVSYHDESVRAFKRARFEETYYFTDGPDNAGE